jgi:hypothetical protein
VTLTIDLQTSISIGFLFLPSGMCLIMRFVDQRSRSQFLKIEQKFNTFSFPHDILRMKCRIKMNLGTSMPDGERRRPIAIVRK